MACRLFHYLLGEEAFYWYINLSMGSITYWDLMMNAFLHKYNILIIPLELYQQFMTIHREINEPINSFNDRFHQAYTRLHAPYTLNDVVSLPVYYIALDNLTATLVKIMQPPLTRLVEAYEEAIITSTDLGLKFFGLLPSLGLVAHLMQAQGLIQAFAH